MGRGRLPLAGLTVLAMLVAAPASATASSTIGSPLPFDGDGSAFSPCNPLCTVIPTAINAGNPVTSPISGVIVRWGASAADFQDPMFGPTTSTVRLRVIRSPAANQWVGVSSGPTEHTVLGFQNAFFAVKPGLPIAQNDYIGVDTVRDTTTDATALRSEAGSSFVLFTDALSNGGAPQVAAPTANIEAFVQATIEADADGDRLGDETQDSCPGSLGALDGCPPETTFTKEPRNKSRKHRAKYAFSSTSPGATFRCKIDKRAFKPCTSPTSFKVRDGKHKFQVQATDTLGAVELTPEKDKFKVLP